MYEDIFSQRFKSGEEEGERERLRDKEKKKQILKEREREVLSSYINNILDRKQYLVIEYLFLIF